MAAQKPQAGLGQKTISPPVQKRRDIQFAEKDEALRQDVHALGIMIGELLIEQGGTSLYNSVETARQLAIAAREGEPDAAEKLDSLVQKLSPAEARDFLKAFSAYFQAVNSAEQVHRIRRRRDYLKDATVRQPLAFDETIFKLRDAGLKLQEISKSFDKLEIEPVFTAHPTETTRRTILRKQQNIARRMVDMQNPALTPQETKACFENIRADVTAIWQTDENPSEAATVFDELEHALFFLTDIIYRVIPSFYEAISDALQEAYGSEAHQLRLPTMVRFASWVGGDLADSREISARIIRETLARQRSLIIDLYYGDCLTLAEKLSQGSSRVRSDERIEERVREYTGHFPNMRGSIPSRYRDMPYRVLLRLIAARLQSTYHDDVYPYESANQFLNDLGMIAESLESNRGINAGLFTVRRLIRRVETFGFHFLTLDIHQDAVQLQRVVGQCLGEADWESQTPGYRKERITRAIQQNELPAVSLDNQSKRTLAICRAIAFCRRKYGHRAIGNFVISNCRGVEDSLSLLLIASWGDLRRKDGSVALDVAPMFETVRDLARCPRIMRDIFADDVYRKHIADRDNHQTVMIGNTEYGADDSFASARWALQWAQSSLVELFEQSSVDFTIFHGRSTGAARGGQAEDTAGGRLRATEHGEIVSERYGLRGIASRTLEKSFSAVAIASALPKEQQPEEKAQWHDIMNEIALTSRDVYKELVFDSKGFNEYFRLATPLDVLQRMRIGAQSDQFDPTQLAGNTRTLPWTFAWTQSRHLLPSWYGFGSGLQQAREKHGAEAIVEMGRAWPFFRHLLTDAEISLAITDLGIARDYSRLAGELHDRFFPLIEAEYERTVTTVLTARKQSELLETQNTLRRSIRLRNPYVDPMSLLQVDLLRRWRAGGREDEQLLNALLASVNGISRGLQNSG